MNNVATFRERLDDRRMVARDLAGALRTTSFYAIPPSSLEGVLRDLLFEHEAYESLLGEPMPDHLHLALRRERRAWLHFATVLAATPVAEAEYEPLCHALRADLTTLEGHQSLYAAMLESPLVQYFVQHLNGAVGDPTRDPPRDVHRITEYRRLRIEKAAIVQQRIVHEYFYDEDANPMIVGAAHARCEPALFEELAGEPIPRQLQAALHLEIDLWHYLVRAHEDGDERMCDLRDVARGLRRTQDLEAAILFDLRCAHYERQLSAIRGVLRAAHHNFS